MTDPKSEPPKPPYTCHKCGKGSWPQGGLPICCFCGAKAQDPKKG